MVTKHGADLPVLCGCFPLAIYFTFGSVYVSMPLCFFVTFTSWLYFLALWYISLNKFFFSIYLFVYFIFGCVWVLVAARGIFRCGVWAPESVGSVVVLRGLSCPAACGILVPRPGFEPPSPELEGRFLSTGPLGKSLCYNSIWQIPEGALADVREPQDSIINPNSSYSFKCELGHNPTTLRLVIPSP